LASLRDSMVKGSAAVEQKLGHTRLPTLYRAARRQHAIFADASERGHAAPAGPTLPAGAEREIITLGRRITQKKLAGMPAVAVSDIACQQASRRRGRDASNGRERCRSRKLTAEFS
jgi:hypothetical protein